MRTTSTLVIFIATCCSLPTVSSLAQNKITGSGSWSLTGNAGTDTAINFIGTKDSMPLIIKVNKESAGYLDYNLTGNTTFGFQSLRSKTQFGNSAFGYEALYSNTSPNNSAFGYRALYFNTLADYNVAVGVQALYNNINGSFNTALGAQALYQNSIGQYNVAIGYRALYLNTSTANTAVGMYALYSNQGANNTAVGYSALEKNTSGTRNTATGIDALGLNKSGNYNTADGFSALYGNRTGSYNSADGYNALYTNKDGSYNTGIGYVADVTEPSFTNATSIGSLAMVDASNKVRIGNGSVTSIGGQVSWTSFSDERIKDNVKQNVPGLAFINQLKPLTYHFNLKKETELTGKRDSVYWDEKYNIEKIQFTGFLAQDVDKAAKNVGYDFSGVDKSGKIMGLRYSDFVVPIVKAIQELSIQNDDLRRENTELKTRLDKLETLMKQIIVQQTAVSN